MGDRFLDESAKFFQWKIRGIYGKNDIGYKSQAFSLCGDTWEVLVHSNNTSDHLSIFLHVFDEAMKPRSWKRKFTASLILVNQINGYDSIIHVIDEGSVVWGNNRFAPLNEIMDPSKGYKLNDTLIIEINFDTELIGEEIASEKKFVWKITNFPRLTRDYYQSSIFEIGGGSWKLAIFPQGVGADGTQLVLCLFVQDSEPLLVGRTINAKSKLIVVNQNDYSRSFITDSEGDFIVWRSGGMIPLSDLHDTAGFIVKDTVILEAEFSRVNVEPLSAMFHSYFKRLHEYIAEDIEESKKSLTESVDMCSSEESLAITGLTVDRQRTVREFWADFADIAPEYFSFEKLNAELGLHKKLKDHMFSALQWSHKTHISLKTRCDELATEADKLEKELQEVDSQKEELKKEWEMLMVKSKQEQLEYETIEKKLADAEEKKRDIEERMSRWS